jgi:hypothetical protein
LKFESEVWVMKKRDERHLEGTQMTLLWHLHRIIKLGKENNQWLQHVQRMDKNRIKIQALQYKPKDGVTGRPRKRWRD